MAGRKTTNPVEAKARDRFLVGSRAYRVHDYVTAVREFSKAVYLDDKHAQYFSARAKAYRELGDFKSALVDYRVAMRLDPDNETYSKTVARLIDMQGHLHLDAKSYVAAKHSFTQAIAEDRAVVGYWLHRAVANIHLEEWKAALSDVDRALTLEARNADAHVLRAKLYWKLGMLPQGNADMTAAVALAPAHPEVVEFEEARWSIAEKAYQSAASLMLLRDSAGAILELHRALELAPDDVKYRVLRAAAYRQEGNFADSLRDIECAARTFRDQLKEDAAAGGSDGSGPSSEQLDNVEHPEISRQRNLTLNAVAILQHQRGNYGHALTLYNKVVQSETTMAQLHDRQVDPRFLLNRGDTYLKINQLQQALADFHRALDSDPKNATTRRRLAVVHDMFGVQLFNEGLVAQAEVEFSTAIEYNPGVAQFFVHRGNAAMYLQKMDLAYRDFQAALKLEPGNAQAAERLSTFNVPPAKSTALTTGVRSSLRRRQRNASVPSAPSRRQVGGRRRRPGNIWEESRKRELVRSGAHSGWLMAQQGRGASRGGRGGIIPMSGSLNLGATRTTNRTASRAAGAAAVRSSGRRRRSGNPNALDGLPASRRPFVGMVTGAVVDPTVALRASSWLDPTGEGDGDGDEPEAAGLAAVPGAPGDGQSQWRPGLSVEAPLPRDMGTADTRPSLMSTASSSRVSRSAGDAGFPPITPTGGASMSGGSSTWGLGRLRSSGGGAGSGRAMSPVVKLTSQWRDKSMADIRAEVIPQRPQQAFLAGVMDEEVDYKTAYFEKAAAFAKKSAAKKGGTGGGPASTAKSANRRRGTSAQSSRRR